MNYNVVLHVDQKNSDILKMALRNAANYLKALTNEKFEIVIVANAGAVLLFTENLSELRKNFEELLERGISFRICANALAENGIARDQLWPGCDIVPAGIVELVKLQNEGFAYIKP